MFRLLESGLPKGPIHRPNLKDLGYFINDEDEIRSVENPLTYFNYFVTKNERFNNILRYSMNTAIKEEVLKRLKSRGLRSIRVPIGASEREPHTPILVSNNLEQAKRVIVLFYEHTQDLGIFAHRIIGGRGGINKGTAICFVDYIQSLPTNPRSGTKSADNGNDAPAIIIANMGELRWWRKGKQAITQTAWFSIPRKSAVHPACRFDEIKNVIPENCNSEEHLAYMFNKVFEGNMLHPEAKLEIIGVAEGAYQVVNFLSKTENWDAFGKRLNALALLAPNHNKDHIANPEFASWLEKRARAYAISSAAPATVLGSASDPQSSIADYGCPTFSLGEKYYAEVLLPRGYKIVLDFFQEVAAVDDYKNPVVIVGQGGQVDSSIHGYGGRIITEKSGSKFDKRPDESPRSVEATISRNIEEPSFQAKLAVHVTEDEFELASNKSIAAEDMSKPTEGNILFEAQIKTSVRRNSELARTASSESENIRLSYDQKIESVNGAGEYNLTGGESKEASETDHDIVKDLKKHVF